jgi:hypothetical protein
VALHPFVGLWPLFQCLDLFCTVSMTSWTRNQPVARLLPAHRTAQTQNKCTQTSVPQVGFVPTFPLFDRAVTVIGAGTHTNPNKSKDTDVYKARICNYFMALKEISIDVGKCPSGNVCKQEKPLLSSLMHEYCSIKVCN